MSTATMQVRINGGAPATGVVATTASQSISPSGVNTSNWTSQAWEIYSYPRGFSPGGAWFLAPEDGRTWRNTKVTPDPFSTGTAWGRFTMRVRVNGNPLALNSDGTPNVFFDPDLTDERTVLEWTSPHSLHDTAFGETNQYDIWGFIDACQKNWRVLEAFMASGGGGGGGGGLTFLVNGTPVPNNPHTILNLIATGAVAVDVGGGQVNITLATGSFSSFTLVRANHATSPPASPIQVLAGQRVLIDCSGGPVTVNAPASPTDSQVFSAFVSVGNPLVNAVMVSGNGQNIRDPQNPGVYGTSCSLLNADQAYDFESDNVISPNRWMLV